MTSTYYRSIAVVFTALTSLTACGGALNYQVRGSDISPGADANVTAAVDTERNLTKLDIKADHLTPPDRVLNGGTTYVAWIRRDTSTPWVRVGALELGDEGRTGTATFTVSEVAFDLEITAEETAGTASPSGKAIFEQRVDDR